MSLLTLSAINFLVIPFSSQADNWFAETLFHPIEEFRLSAYTKLSSI